MAACRTRRCRALLLPCLLIIPACDNGPDTLIGPIDATAPFISRAVTVEPAQATVTAVAIPGALCPQPTFFAPVSLVVRSDRGSGVALDQVQMQFVDVYGIRTPTRTVTRAGLLDQFGSTIVPPLSARTFPLQFPFGCVGLPPGTLTIVVVLSDSNGLERTTLLRVGVR